MNLQNKTVLITGANGGIGTAIVEKLLAKGCTVYGLDLKKKEVTTEVGKYISIAADVTKYEEMQRAVAEISGNIDVLIHCAGVMYRGDMFECGEQDYDFVMDINLKGVWILQKLINSKLDKGALVLFLSSRHGFNPKADPFTYSLSKAGLTSFAKILMKTREDLEVKVAFPGPIDTPMSWIQIPPELIEEKKRIVVTPSYIADKLTELMESPKDKFLQYNEHNLYYEMFPVVEGFEFLKTHEHDMEV